MADPIAFFKTAFHQPRFGALMRRYRGHHRVSLRQAATESGVPRATWDRGEGGADLRLSAVYKILTWMEQRGKPGDADPP